MMRSFYIRQKTAKKVTDYFNAVENLVTTQLAAGFAYLAA